MRFISLFLVTSLLTAVYSKNVFNYGKLKPLKNRGKRSVLPIMQHPLFQEPEQQKDDTVNKIYIPNGEEPQEGPTLLTSSMSVNKEISVFAKYVRDNVEICSRFNDRKRQSIVFAPTDLGISTLPLKPWQFPTTVDETKSEREQDEIIASNLNDFVLSHTIDGELPFNVLKDAKKGVQFISENGGNIKLVNDNGEYYVTAVKNGRDQEWLKVERISTADNGAVLVISKPLSTPSI